MAHLAETLEVLAERLVGALSHCAEVVEGEVVLVGALEVGNELQAQLLEGVDASLGEVHEPGDGDSFEGHGHPVGHALVVPLRGADGEAVELLEVEWRGGAVVAGRERRVELRREGDGAQLLGERQAAPDEDLGA